ncbi:MAG: GIY-YIG nuclease family protein [Bacteroidota bacterium]
MDDRNIPAIYILTNFNNTVLYTGVTHSLIKRVTEHKEKKIPGFSQRYNLTKLVYFEYYRDIRDAIAREKQLKAGSRKKKIALIESMNPLWSDLFNSLA